MNSGRQELSDVGYTYILAFLLASTKVSCVKLPVQEMKNPVYGPTSSQTRELVPPWLSSPPVFLLGFAEAGI